MTEICRKRCTGGCTRKCIAALAAVPLVLSLAACGGGSGTGLAGSSAGGTATTSTETEQAGRADVEHAQDMPDDLTLPRARDHDKDGLSNAREAALGTNPRKADTDNDGIKDGPEVIRYHTNPRKADTDGDGLRDGAEVFTYKSNPLHRDGDGDGWPDHLEVANKTNPAKADNGPYPPIPLRYYSGHGARSDWTWKDSYHPRWDPTMPRRGHAGKVITWYYDPAGGPAKVTAATVAKGLAPWEKASGFTLRQVNRPADADVKITWSVRGYGGDAMAPRVLADTSLGQITRYAGDSDWTITEAHIRLNPKSEWVTNPSDYEVQWVSVFTHEFGHALGLGHSRGNDQVMNATGTRVTKLGVGDLNGLHAVSAYKGAVD